MATTKPPSTADGNRVAAFHFSAGLGSGVLSAVLLQPIDLLKTRVQQSGSRSLRSALNDIRAAPHLVPALWRGAVPSALRTGFGSAIYFTTLNAIRQHVVKVPGLRASAVDTTAKGNTWSTRVQSSSALVKLSNLGNLLTGGTARALAGFVLMPLTVLKVRYESNLYNYRSLVGAAQDIWTRDGGMRGFFVGFGATAMRDAPYAGLYVLFYEQCKNYLGSVSPTGKDSTSTADGMAFSRAASINFASALISAVICSLVSNPFDAVKTRIQLQPHEYHNTYHAARRMVLEEGLRSLMDGLALRMSRKALSSALAWTVYEDLIRRAESAWGPRAEGPI